MPHREIYPNDSRREGGDEKHNENTQRDKHHSPISFHFLHAQLSVTTLVDTGRLIRYVHHDRPIQDTYHTERNEIQRDNNEPVIGIQINVTNTFFAITFELHIVPTKFYP